MRIIVLGGCGAWPAAGQACSGYVLEHDGFRLVVDPGYATLPRLLEHMTADDVDAVLVSHSHPDHCADLHPLLRARALQDDPPPALPVYAMPGAADRVLALDGPDALRGAAVVHEFEAGDTFEVGPLRVDSWLLPHFVPNAGLRLTAGQQVIAYTGDCGPSLDLVELADAADLFLAEATYVDEVPGHSAAYLSSARQAAECAVRADAGRVLLTHLWPGTDPDLAAETARRVYAGDVGVARPGLVVHLG